MSIFPCSSSSSEISPCLNVYTLACWWPLPCSTSTIGHCLSNSPSSLSCSTPRMRSSSIPSTTKTSILRLYLSSSESLTQTSNAPLICNSSPDELASLMVSWVNTFSSPPISSNFCLLATAAVLPESQRASTTIGGPFTQPLFALHTAICLLGSPSAEVLKVQTHGCLHLAS